MANAYLIPFNGDPTLIDYGSSSRSYTCPAGKYAIITAMLDVTMTTSLSLSSNNNQYGYAPTLSDKCSSFKMTVESGDVVTATVFSGDTDSSYTNVSASEQNYSNYAEAILLNNSNVVAKVKTTGLINFFYQGSAVMGTAYYKILGTGTVNFHVEEFDSIT